MGNTAAGQTGTVYLGAQTLTLTGALTAFGGVIADAGGIDNVAGGGLTLGPTATGTETLTGVNTYTGATTISAGTLALAGTGSIALSSGVADNGTFDISGLTNGGTTITTLSGTGGVTLGANTLTLSNASSTFGGDISGTGGLTLTAGTERLSGASTYTGATNVDGGRLLVSGSIGSLATPSGPVNVASGAILGLRGSITSSGLTNSGTVYARGTLNAPVVNNSVFNVTGNLAGTTTFTNNPTAALNVNNGTFAMSGLLANFASVNVAAGAGLSAGSLDNVSTGTIVNLGTVTDDLNNAGTVMNYGVYNANVASNTGSITNFASGAWNGNAVNTGGTIENDGLWTGSLTNMAGTLTNNGEIVGNVVASGGTVNSFASTSAIVGNVTLPGSPAVVNALGVITGNVNVMPDFERFLPGRLPCRRRHRDVEPGWNDAEDADCERLGFGPDHDACRPDERQFELYQGQWFDQRRVDRAGRRADEPEQPALDESAQRDASLFERVDPPHSDFGSAPGGREPLWAFRLCPDARQQRDRAAIEARRRRLSGQPDFGAHHRTLHLPLPERRSSPADAGELNA